MITGNIDLSIGSVVGMSCMISATMMTKGIGPWVAVFITYICCIAVGVTNGQLVANCKLPPFIATLGTMTIARGIAQIVNNNYNTDSIGTAAKGFRDFFYYGKIWVCSIPFGLLLSYGLFLILFSVKHEQAVIFMQLAVILRHQDYRCQIVTTTTIAYVVSSICACQSVLLPVQQAVWALWMQVVVMRCMQFAASVIGC